MNRQEVIAAACLIVHDAHEHVGYHTASDCFCGEGGLWAGGFTDADYRNEGVALDFVRQAVREKIQRDTSHDGAHR